MKNHLEFWSEHPVISKFWLIVHTITMLGVIVGVGIVAADWFYGGLDDLKVLADAAKEKIRSLYENSLHKSANEEEL